MNRRARPIGRRVALREKRRNLRLEGLEDRSLLAAGVFPTPLTAEIPPGSLIYTSSAAAEIDSVGDVDSFTVGLDDGQTVTVVVEGEAPLQMAVRLSDADGVEIGEATGTAAGEDVVIQTVATTGAGTYTVTVSGEGGTTGGYTTRLIVNAAIELEDLNGLPNDEMGSAQDVDSSFLSLGKGSGERGGALGALATVVTNLGPNVNTADLDRHPTFSADGLTILFSSNRPGGVGNQDLYWATRASVSEPFGKTSSLGTEINTTNDDLAPSLSADSLTLIFASNRPGGLGGHDLYMATRSDITEPFANVTNLGSGVNTDRSESNPSLSADGLSLYFHSSREVGFGGLDIFVARRRDMSESFGNVANLGSPVNDPGSAGAPSISADGRTLFFNSNRPGGIGGMDLYRADLTTFSVAHLGPAVNSSSNDRAPSVSFDGLSLLFESDRPGGEGSADVYLASFEADWYRFTLTDRQLATLALTSLEQEEATLELYDSSANLLAMGMPATNADRVIDQFLDTTNNGNPDTYFARVVGASGEYSLVVTRDASFDIEPNDNLLLNVQDVTLTGTLLGAAEAGGSDFPNLGSTQVALPTVFTDGEGFQWDIQGDGHINDGTSDAYDGGLIHIGFPGFSNGTAEHDARDEIVIGPATIGDIQVRRKIYVSQDQGFARFLEIITNTSESTAEYAVGIFSDLGSDNETQLIGSAWDVDDDWLVTDDRSDGGDDPTVLHVFAGKGGRRPPWWSAPAAPRLLYASW